MDSLSADRADRAIWALRTVGDVPSDSVTSWIFRSLYFSDFHPVTGPYNGVISSGDLRLIEPDSLRTLIAQFLGEIQGAADQMRVYDQVSTRNISELGRVIDLAHVSGWWNGRDGIWPQFRHIPKNQQMGLQPLRIDDLRKNSGLQRVLIDCYVNGLNRAFMLRGLIDLNHRMQQQLEAALRPGA